MPIEMQSGLGRLKEVVLSNNKFKTFPMGNSFMRNTMI
jgi:Leucine-rich repeat (LRR) protein